MTFSIKTLAIATIVSFGALNSAFAQDNAQLIASAGLTQAEASGLTLTEIAAAKFNRDTSADNRQTVSKPERVAVDPTRHAQLIAAARLDTDEVAGLSISELGVSKYNVGASGDEQQSRARMFSRGPIATAPAYFIAAAGLSQEEARGLSLNEVYAAKLAKEGHGNYDQ